MKLLDGFIPAAPPQRTPIQNTNSRAKGGGVASIIEGGMPVFPNVSFSRHEFSIVIILLMLIQ